MGEIFKYDRNKEVGETNLTFEELNKGDLFIKEGGWTVRIKTEETRCIYLCNINSDRDSWEISFISGSEIIYLDTEVKRVRINKLELEIED